MDNTSVPGTRRALPKDPITTPLDTGRGLSIPSSAKYTRKLAFYLFLVLHQSLCPLSVAVFPHPSQGLQSFTRRTHTYPHTISNFLKISSRLKAALYFPIEFTPEVAVYPYTTA